MEATSLSARNSKGWGGSCTPADAPTRSVPLILYPPVSRAGPGVTRR